MGKLVMGYWDCPVCGTKEIRGDVQNCPACGRARGDVKFYMKNYTEGEIREENERGDIEYLSEDEAKYVSKNPDWYCSFCNSLNSDNAEYCSNCGSSRKDSESNYFDQLKKRKEREEAELAAQPHTAVPQKSSKKPLFILALVVLAIILLFSWMNGNKTAGDLKVTALNWVRNINIEKNIQYSESGWALPAGAELVDQKEEYHHSDSVLTGYIPREVERSRRVLDHYETYYTYEDMGNGYMQEVPHERPVYKTEYYTETIDEPVYAQVPRYATKYYYTIWRWSPGRDVTSSGDNHETAWPEYTLEENEREGKRSEAYSFTVTNSKGETAEYRLAEKDWMNLNAGDSIFITAKRSGAEPYISDEKGNKIADIVQIR